MRLHDALTPVGLLIALGALVWQQAGGHLPGQLVWWLLAGIALVVVHLVLRWQDVADTIGVRQLLHGGNALVLTLLVLGILGGVNFLVKKYNKRWDLTENQRYSLSDQTRKAVSGLSEDVTITYFGRPEDMMAARGRLEDYSALSPKLRVEFVDPLKDPVKTQSFGAQPPWPILFVDRGERRERLTADTENDITNALLKVARDVEKTVCFVQGEGERDPDDRSEAGLSSVRASLENQYVVEKVTLLREPAVPEKCAVTVLAGPEYDLAPGVVELLRDYVKKGGALFVMLEPPLDGGWPNLEALLAGWGIEAGANVVIDVSLNRALSGTNEFTPLADAYDYHEITKDFRVATAYSTARTMSASSERVEGVVAQDLVKTGREAWAETDLANLNAAEPQPGVDPVGPLSLAAVATVEVEKDDAATAAPAADAAEADEGAKPDETKAEDAKAEDAKSEDADADEAEAEDTTPARTGRVVAFGDVDFASNAWLAVRGNQDLFLNSVAWLAEDADLISIRPRAPDDQRLFLTELEQTNLALLALLVIPGLFVVGGIATWWVRR